MTRASKRIAAYRRAELEARIEDLIAMLDEMDGDPDLEDTGDDEPSLLGMAIVFRGRVEHDVECDYGEYGEYCEAFEGGSGL